MILKSKILIFVLTLAMLFSVVGAFGITASAAEKSYSYTFSNYAAGTQYAKNEVHQLDKNVKITTTECHFTSELRIYSSSTHNGFAIINSYYPITAIAFNAGNKADTIVISGSNDGSSFTKIGEIAVKSSYADYSFDFGDDAYKYVKIDVKGDQQVRLKSIKLTVDEVESSCTHPKTVAIGEAKEATCDVDGITAGEKCTSCGFTVSDQKTIPALGHNYVNGFCSRCEKEEPQDVKYHLQATINGTVYYWNGVVSSGKGTLVTDASKAVELHLEEKGSAFYLYFLDASGAKKYVTIGTSNTSLGVSTTATTISYNSKNGYIYNATSQRYIATYGNQDVRTYQTSNIPGSSDNAYMVLTEVVGGAVPGCTEHTDKDGDFKCDNNGCGAVVTPAADSVLTIEQALALGKLFTKDTYTESKYYLTGVIENVENTTYGNMYIADENGNKILVYGVYSADGKTQYNALTVKPVAGDTITVYGVIGFYTNPQMKSGWMTAHTPKPCEHVNVTTTTTVEADCMNAGSEAVICDDCGETVSTNNIPALGHKYDEVVTAPTFGAQGYTTHTCSVCGDSYVDNYVDAKSPAGTISYRAYINDSADREAVAIDLSDVAAGSSVVIKLYDANGNLLTTTTLNAGGVEAANYTCNIVLWGRASSSWTTEIAAELTVENAPETIELWCDGVLVDSFDNALGAGTNVDEVPEYLALDCVYKEAEIDGKLYATLQSALNAAVDGDVVTLLNDVEVSKYLDVFTANNGEIARDFTLDLNGFNISTADDYKVTDYGLIFIGINQTLTIVGNGTITSPRGTTIGVYGVLNLKGGTIVNNGTTDNDVAIAIHYWNNDDPGYVGTVGGTGYITGGNVQGAVYCDEPDEDGSAKLEISGGIFSEPVDYDYCTSGYIPTENADGSYGVAYYPIYEYVKYHGRSIRYATDNGSEPINCVDLRVSYNLGDAVIKWGWTYRLGNSEDMNFDGKYRSSTNFSNIVFTDVAFVNLEKNISVKLWVIVVIDGVETRFEEPDFHVFTTYDVLKIMEEQYADTPAGVYSKSVLAEYEAYKQNEQVIAILNDEEND